MLKGFQLGKWVPFKFRVALFCLIAGCFSAPSQGIIVSLKAVKVNDQPVEPANAIDVTSGDRIVAELFFSDWTPQSLTGYLLGVDHSSFVNQIDGDDVLLALVSCTSNEVCFTAFGSYSSCESQPDGDYCVPGLVDILRSDYVFAELSSFALVDSNPETFRIGGNSFGGGASDLGPPRYGGTLFFDAPSLGDGLFEIGFLGSPNSYFSFADSGELEPIDFQPLVIRVVCPAEDNDSDGDGRIDCRDACPNDPLKTDPGICGCGAPDIDQDTDLIMDCVDNCGLFNPDQADCQPDGTGDVCDVMLETSEDCNGNIIPDECELAQHDCNANVRLDACDLEIGESLDCNTDFIPDECQIRGNDCNINSRPDKCDIALGTSFDCDGDSRPDECGVLHICEVQKLTALDASSMDQFGASVDVDDEVALVGAPLDDRAGCIDCGAIYSLRREGHFWIQDQKLVGFPTTAGDAFGNSVALNGGTAVVGAFRANPNGCLDCGAAFVFRRSSNSWVQEARLLPPAAVEVDQFGASVDIDGDTIAIGANLVECSASTNAADAADCPECNNCGAAHVFRHDGQGWVHEIKLTASDGESDDRFGSAIAIKGDWLVVGTPNDDRDDCPNCGAAFVFRRSNGIWSEVQKLVASNAVGFEGFGSSVAIDGNIILVGAPLRGREGCSQCGAAYVFRFDGTVWNEEVILESTPNEPTHFGNSVAINGATAVVGAWLQNCTSSDCGAAYVYRFESNVWTRIEQLISSDAAANDRLGSAVGISGDRILVGASLEDRQDCFDCGAVYSFTIGHADCNCDGLGDACQLATDERRDCNANAILDECEELFVVIESATPAHGTVDARQPHALANSSERQGIGSVAEPIYLRLGAPTGAPPSCFALCETVVDPISGPNSIVDAVELLNGEYEIVLDHAITAGGVTTIEYLPSHSVITYFSHPANVNGDALAGAVDILALIDYLNGVADPPHGIYSLDMDHSSMFGAPDLLRLIDLLNGAGELDPWLGTPRPSDAGCH